MNDINQKQTTCKSCGMKPSTGELNYCEDCMTKDQHDYQKIRAYLRLNPNANAMQIANETGISVSRITYFIKNGSFNARSSWDK
ncbi:hypothetical protein B0H94_104204 [Salsuginibacillus halophilus]|uniref:Flagellar operon protein (TIGR03826 family) n=1 Tax=Salsuginibacillus halophilus TaxID=517424 RepID=A0A2P8HQV4_9BACI|nr:hypothetical protein [Salsuginibacillus halophilus]PSL48603.1 hypothetical protein B0H94_104204 [Salsuginibacillus halophilus]